MMTLTAKNPLLVFGTYGYRLNRESVDTLKQHVLAGSKDPAEKVSLLQRIEQDSKTFFHLQTEKEQQATLNWMDEVCDELKVEF